MALEVEVNLRFHSFTLKAPAKREREKVKLQFLAPSAGITKIAKC